MAAYRLALREPRENANAASPKAPTFGAVLEKGLPFPADRASPKAPNVGALAFWRGSENVKQYETVHQLAQQML